MNFNKYIDFRKLVKLILIFILFYFSSLFKVIPLLIFNLNPDKLSDSTSMLLNIFSSLCVLSILLFIYRKDLRENLESFKKRPFKILDTSFKYYLIGIFGMMFTNILITFFLKGTGATNEKLVQDMIEQAPFLMFINAGILGPIIEELVFRKAYLDTFKTKFLFIFMSSFIFGLMHVITTFTNLVSFLYLIPYALLGFGLSFMDYQEDSVIPSIIMHALHNSVLIILSVLA